MWCNNKIWLQELLQYIIYHTLDTIIRSLLKMFRINNNAKVIFYLHLYFYILLSYLHDHLYNYSTIYEDESRIYDDMMICIAII